MSKVRCPWGTLCLAMSLACCGVWTDSRAAEPAEGEVTPAASAASVLRFRRVFVPRDQIEQLCDDHMPMDREKFKASLQSANSRARTMGPAAARVESAWYYAAHDDQYLTQGLANLQVVHATEGTVP